ncbi:lactococcin 972 family bacteriocin [Glycomyces albidus]|uniref:lactococcin 972 family bacteriocin n=1 Tax=Glycomyces albidus TaxID=2656774 RepID=UPI002AD536A3|nr:lactococcin 972 family bacteriocin [Glycomyces albidus]
MKQHLMVAVMSAAILVGGTTAVQAEAGTAGLESVRYENFCRDVDGGTWCTGTASGSDPFSKVCYSNYFHPTNRHSATAMMASGTDRQVADAGEWAKASVEAGAAHTCYTKYNPDA